MATNCMHVMNIHIHTPAELPAFSRGETHISKMFGTTRIKKLSAIIKGK